MMAYHRVNQLNGCRACRSVLDVKPRERALLPVGLAATVGVIGTVLVLLATAGGWLGPDVDRGAQFCETAHWCLFAQPSNTLSNLGFVLAGCLFAWHARRPWFRMHTLGLTTIFAVTIVLLGPASMAMHATETAAGGHLDVLSMHLIAAFSVAYALARIARWSTAHAALVFVAIVSVSTRIAWRGDQIVVLQHTGNLIFVLLVAAAVTMEIVLWRRVAGPRPRWGLASVGTLLLAFSIWLVSQTGGVWCVAESWLQGHALWHLLCALATYFLGRHYVAMTRSAGRQHD